jgi:hypothetical protein
MTNLDAGLAVGCELRPVSGDRRVHIQLATIHQNERSERCHGLRHRPGGRDGVSQPRRAVLDISPAAPQVHEGNAVPHNGDRRTEVFSGVQVFLKQIAQR